MGENSNFTSRLGQHVGTATEPCKVDIVKPVGRHFCLPGQRAHSDLIMLPIKIVSARDPFLLRARETFNITKFKTEKRLGVSELEHGLNLDKGQVGWLVGRWVLWIGITRCRDCSKDRLLQHRKSIQALESSCFLERSPPTSKPQLL